VPLSFIISQCFHKNKAIAFNDPRGAAFAGSATCVKCHKNITENYLHTAHYLTGRPASEATIHGSFNPDSNTVIFNDSIKIVMEKHPDGLYQASYTNGKLTQKHRFEMTFGSKRAETFLFWKGKEVFELPVSYYISLHQWATSPGAYYGDSVNFSRKIGQRCFECHSSYIQNIPNENSTVEKTEWMDKKSLVLGIDCERCHGPGAQHVNFHLQNPEEKLPMYMKKISSLPRERRMDLCSVCHSGNSKIMINTTFDFKPGDTLSHFENGDKNPGLKKIDVHGNQAELLAGSQCFIKSNIECSTCHSVHDSGVKTVKMYSQACTSCHSEAKHNFCKMAGQLGHVINNNCIDCHMPIKSSSSVVINAKGKPPVYPFEARMHRIAIYPEETKKYQLIK
jgi:hypothetical protein